MTIGESYNNNEICKIFKCSGQGGMRKSNSTNSLVLVVNHVKNIYEDKWIEDILHYTGEGQSGDQTITKQNKTLYYSRTSDIKIYLFEVFRSNEYIYQGEVTLAGEPYQIEEKDIDNKLRKVWKFPIKLKEGENRVLIPEELVEASQKSKEAKARKLTNEQLLERLKENKDKKPNQRNVVIKHKERNPAVVEYTKRRAKGVCDLCGEKAPFNSRSGEPYLEVHHVVMLSEDGPDQIYNTVALCPNCHKKMHVVKNKKDKEKLKQVIYQYLLEEHMEEYIEEFKRLF